MKKKILAAAGTLAIAVAAFVATNANALSGETSLASLLKINTASAECCSTPINNGRCSWTGTMCFPDAGGSNNNCDSTKGNC